LFTLLEVGNNKHTNSLCTYPHLVQIFNIETLMGNFLENGVKILKLFVGVVRWYTSKCVKKKINKLNCWFLIIFLSLF
jgi:hypothetical protein